MSDTTPPQVTITLADREAAASTYDEFFGCKDHKADDMAGDWLARRFAAHRLAAIEEAAKVADSFYQAYPRETASDVTAWEIATAIRKLGETA